MTPPPTDDLLAELPWLRRFAGGLCRSAADADDLVQDTLSAALRADRPSGPLRGLLAGIARNLSRSGHRDAARRGAREVRHAQDAGPDASAPADAEAERLDLLRALLDELSALPPAQRRAITARYLDELEPAEIARRDGVSPSSVRSQLARGLGALRERLDGRAGGRDAWMASLAPWALGPAAWPPVTDPTSAPPAATSSPVTSVSTQSLVGASLAGAAVMKLATLFVIPALLAVLWWQGRTPDPAPLDQSTAVLEQDLGAPESLAPPEVSTSRVDAVESVAADQAETAAPESAPLAAPAPVVIDGTFVDVHTGEPVPEIGATFAFRHGGNEYRARSDDRGRFQLEIEYVPEDADSIRVFDRDGTINGQQSEVRQSTVPFPIEASVPVHVGPTFYVDLPEEMLENGWRIQARMRTPDDRRPFDDPRATLREGDRPWFRLPYEVTELEGGAYELIIEDRVAMLAARMRVDRNRGIEPRVLRPEFERRGELRFVVGVEGAAQAPMLKFDVTPVGHEVPVDVELRAMTSEHGADGSVTGRLRLLPPGLYSWVLVGGGTEANGEVEVVAGETVDVEIGPEHLGATFDSDVIIDAAAAPDARIDECLVMVTSEDEAGAGFMTRPRAVDGSPGRFRIPLRALSHGTWRVAVQTPSDVTLTPGTVIVTPGAPPATMVATAGSGRVKLQLDVVGASDGKPLPNPTGSIVIVPSEQIRFVHGAVGDPSLVSDEVPGDQPVEIFVRAAGHRGVLLRHDARTDPAHRVVKLERGWSSRVLALDVVNLAPLEGVEVIVDGKVAGKTGKDGWLWIEGDEAPLRVSLELDDPGLEVIGSPYDGGGTAPEDLDPPFGLIFMIAPQTDR